MTLDYLRNLADQSDYTFDVVQKLEFRVEKLEKALEYSRVQHRTGYSYAHFDSGATRLDLYDSGMFTGLKTPAMIGVLIGLVASYWLVL